MSHSTVKLKTNF